MKRCTKCGEVKPVAEFYRAARTSRAVDGLHSHCKDCARAAARKRYADTKEQRQAYRRQYVAHHPEKARAADKASYLKHKRKREAVKKAWAAKNRSKMKAYYAEYDAARKGKRKRRSKPEYNERYYAKHRDKLRIQAKAYRQAHPTEERVWKHRRRARKLSVKSDLTAEQFQAICAAQRGRCARCGKRRKLTIDHVIPISKQGPDTAENVQALCHPCNSSKQAKDTDYRRALLLPFWKADGIV